MQLENDDKTSTIEFSSKEKVNLYFSFFNIRGGGYVILLHYTTECSRYSSIIFLALGQKIKNGDYPAGTISWINVDPTLSTLSTLIQH